jgi:hypothetical protein
MIVYFQAILCIIIIVILPLATILIPIKLVIKYIYKEWLVCAILISYGILIWIPGLLLYIYWIIPIMKNIAGDALCK